MVECNTAEVRAATVCPKYGTSTPALRPPGPASAVPLVLGAGSHCVRSSHCNQPAGHPGFCSGPKAAAAAAALATTARAAPLRAHARLPSEACSARPASCPSSCSGEEAGPLAAPTPLSRSTRATPFSSASAATTAELPPGLHTLAHIPAGLSVAKALTGYDLTSRRVVMPAPEVEEGVANAASRDVLTLAAVDESEGWQFPELRAWTSVAGRRGYLLEGAAPFLARRGAQPGDTLALYRDSDLEPPVRSARPACLGGGRSLPFGQRVEGCEVWGGC